ncbi:hypothetical protein ES702_06491 [subsurface metagenome]
MFGSTPPKIYHDDHHTENRAPKHQALRCQVLPCPGNKVYLYLWGAKPWRRASKCYFSVIRLAATARARLPRDGLPACRTLAATPILRPPWPRRTSTGGSHATGDPSASGPRSRGVTQSFQRRSRHGRPFRKRTPFPWSDTIMSPQELHPLIRTIQALPDNLLIRVLMATTSELLRRTSKTLKEIREDFDKDEHDTRNHNQD